MGTRAKLSPAQRQEITRQFIAGRPQIELAADYEVTQATISRVIRDARVAWQREAASVYGTLITNAQASIEDDIDRARAAGDYRAVAQLQAVRLRGLQGQGPCNGHQH